MRLSADLSTEDMYVAQKFARVAVGSNRVRCTAAETYGAALNGMLRTLKVAASPAALAEADAILCVGLNTRYAQSIVETELVRAQRRGAKLFTIHPHWHGLSLHADRWLQQTPGQLSGLLDSLARMVGGEPAKLPDGLAPAIAAELPELAGELRAARHLAVVLGAETLAHPHAAAILESVEALARSTGATVVPLVPEGNLTGSFLAGAYPELNPGGGPGEATPPAGGDPQVLYLIGVAPPAASQATIIYQNIDAPPEGRGADLILSTAAFSEAEGTLVDLDRRVRDMRPAVPPPGEALPTWEILCRIARAMGAQGFDYTGIAEIQAEIAEHIDGYASGATLSLDGLTPAFGAAAPSPRPAGRDAWPFILTTRVTPHTYMGIPLSRRVAGMRDILPEDALSIHPEDASGAGIAAGDSVVVRTPQFERTWPVRLDPDLQPGTLLITLQERDGVGAVITPAEIRTAHVSAD
jgi:predicted molibdopterin-dependent oxidoreductase YjgC